jgi:hypothetical protein
MAWAWTKPIAHFLKGDAEDKNKGHHLKSMQFFSQASDEHEQKANDPHRAHDRTLETPGPT